MGYFVRLKKKKNRQNNHQENRVFALNYALV